LPDDDRKFDIIIVGAGPGGCSAGITAARGGLRVAMFERGEFSGNKIVMGNMVITTVLNELIPDLEEKAPLGRFIRSRRYACLTEETSVSLDITSNKYNKPPHNNLWTLTRQEFDPWLAKRVEKEGVKYFDKTPVNDLIKKGSQVVGVNTKKGEYYGDIVIIANGANSRLVRQMGDHVEYPPDSYILGIKELIKLPPETIEQRFCLQDREGCAIEYYGYPIEGNVGSAFVYTNWDSLSVGAIFNARSLKGAVRNAPVKYLQLLKIHPTVKRLIQGGRTIGLSAHIVPEIGFDYLRSLYCDGALVVGDAAGFLNANMYPLGMLMATASGKLAGETAIEAKKIGNYSSRTLSLYMEKIDYSFFLDDMRKYNRSPFFSNHYPEFFEIYPKMAVELMEEYHWNDEESTRKRQQNAFQKVRNELTIFPFLREIFESGRRSRFRTWR